MHTFLLFFAWPFGGVWSNVLAMPACGVVAGVATVCLRRPLAAFWHRHFSHRAELDDIKARLDGHADLLNPHSPGGLGAVHDEVRRAVTAAESAVAEVRALTKVMAPTPMRRTADGRFAKSSSEEKKP